MDGTLIKGAEWVAHHISSRVDVGTWAVQHSISRQYYIVSHTNCVLKQTNKTPSSMRYFFFGSVWQCQQRYFLSDLDSKWFEKWNRGVWKWSSCLIFITEWLWGIGGLGFRTAKETCLLVLNFSMDGPRLRPPSSASSQWGSPQRREDWVGLLVTRSREGGSYEPTHPAFSFHTCQSDTSQSPVSREKPGHCFQGRKKPNVMEVHSSLLQSVWQLLAVEFLYSCTPTPLSLEPVDILHGKGWGMQVVGGT